MKCEDCGAEIPESEVVYVDVNGHKVQYPYCRKCAEEWKKKLDKYPKRS